MKKVLIITYYWPPAGGPGVQRMVRYAKYLPKFGWEPIILTVKDGDFPARDELLARELPPDIKVYRSGSVEPFSLFKFLSGSKKNDPLPTFVLNKEVKEGAVQRIGRFIRANLFIPDARVGWVPFLYRKASKIIRREKPDLILSSSPPHSMTLAVRRLAKKFSLPWIADLRDPWTEAFWEKEIRRLSWLDTLNKSLERKSLEAADHVTTVSEGLGEMFLNKGAKRFTVIHNGYENLDLEPRKSDFFKIYYFGHLAKMQSPESLVGALSLLSREQRKSIKLIFAGKVFPDYRALLSSVEDLETVFHDYMPKAELLQMATDASLLLKIAAESGYSQASVGTKIYDYLSLRRKMLIIGGEKGTLSRIMAESGRGAAFAQDDMEGIRLFLDASFREWKENGSLSVGDGPEVEKFSSENNISRLAEIMDGLSR